MTENTFAALIFSMVGVLYIGLGMPLLLGRVPPNGFYGCRTRKRSQMKIWYAVNRVTGRDLIIGGAASGHSPCCSGNLSLRPKAHSKPCRNDTFGGFGIVGCRNGDQQSTGSAHDVEWLA